jgi:acyl carrier protein
MTTTFDRVSALLVKDYKLAPEQLTMDSALDSLGIDSLGTVELLWNVEDAFAIKLPSDPQGLATLGDVVRLIDDLVGAQAADAVAPAGTTTSHPP